MEQSAETPDVKIVVETSETVVAEARSKFAALPERISPEQYVQEVDVEQVHYAQPDLDDWLKNSAG
ncbi:uncharacterized protein (DUF427 family) [Psychromicrobium silvestre]|uniref:Uncharacterized protein (DUF427 family) n=1 Tax=Psychromicrobium silvestre TaxID=1645614 RepID=A0A7Y9LQS2_9MICC|nr:hypothetical protein [Psychromicrobium silvestre]NYE93868.1 uncharacterized protein (DUF427 family) [Psychromicrobium silvestre]